MGMWATKKGALHDGGRRLPPIALPPLVKEVPPRHERDDGRFAIIDKMQQTSGEQSSPLRRFTQNAATPHRTASPEALPYKKPANVLQTSGEQSSPLRRFTQNAATPHRTASPEALPYKKPPNVWQTSGEHTSPLRRFTQRCSNPPFVGCDVLGAPRSCPRIVSP